MAGLDTESSPAPDNGDAAPPRDSSGSGVASDRSQLLSIARIGGALLLFASAAMHLVLSSQGDPAELLSLSFAVIGVVGAVLGAAVLLGSGPALVAGALYVAAIAGAQIIGAVAGDGYHQDLSDPYASLSPWFHIAGLVLLATAAWLMRKQSAEPPEQASEKAADQKAAVAEEAPVEPATLLPGRDPRNPDFIRWPAERAQRVTIATNPATAAEPKPAAPRAPLKWRSRGAVAGEAATRTPAEPAADEAMPGVTIASDAATVAAARPVEPDQTIERPEHSPDQMDGAAGEPAPADLAAEAEPGEQPGEEPEVPSEPEERVAAREPVAVTVPEPYYGMLVREQRVLSRIEGIFGPDDPRALNTRSVIAYYYISAGDFIRGAQIQQGVVADCARILGADHPHTVMAQKKYREWRKLAKRQRRAKTPVPG